MPRNALASNVLDERRFPPHRIVQDPRCHDTRRDVDTEREIHVEGDIDDAALERHAVRDLDVRLFGSEARGEATPESHIDVLVVGPGAVRPHRRALTRRKDVCRMARLSAKLRATMSTRVRPQPCARAARFHRRLTPPQRSDGPREPGWCGWLTALPPGVILICITGGVRCR
jgi:predicted nucleotidyltransferase